MRTRSNRFHGKVDLDRIALIGHSRGGEAVAIAALFNRLPFYPDDGARRVRLRLQPARRHRDCTVR